MISYPMLKKKTFQTLHVYYIDEMNGHRYVADRKVTLGQFHNIVCNTGDTIILELLHDPTYTRFQKVYKTKEEAEKHI